MAEQLHPEDIYQTLEHDIVTLKIKPGETISENQLCKRFGISRTPVRAALQRLGAQVNPKVVLTVFAAKLRTL